MISKSHTLSDVLHPSFATSPRTTENLPPPVARVCICIGITSFNVDIFASETGTDRKILAVPRDGAVPPLSTKSLSAVCLFHIRTGRGTQKTQRRGPRWGPRRWVAASAWMVRSHDTPGAVFRCRCPRSCPAVFWPPSSP